METLLNTNACTLPTGDRPLRLTEFENLFAKAVRRVERRNSNLRLYLRGEEGLVEEVNDLIQRETSCCSFFSFDLAGDHQNLVLKVSVPPARQRILDDLAERARKRSM